MSGEHRLTSGRGTALTAAHECLPLSTLLSFAWTAFTIEIDNAFEARMPHRTTVGGGRSGPWLVSHVMWWTCMRYIDQDGMRAQELEAHAGFKTNLNGMIRWGYVTVDPIEGGRDLHRTNPLIRATAKGLAAREVWRPLPGDVENLWRQRKGEDTVDELRAALAAIGGQSGPDLPDCMPILGYGLAAPLPRRTQQPPHAERNGDLALVAMLARVLVSFTLDYERAAGVSLAVAANVLRLIDGEGMRVRDLPVCSGVSKEAIGVALSFLEKQKMAQIVTNDRVRFARLTSSGLKAKAEYEKLRQTVEADWRCRFGEEPVLRLRQALERIAAGRAGDTLRAEVIASSKGGWRSKSPAPSTLPWQAMVLHRGGFPDGA